MWTPEDIAEHANDPDFAQLLELSSHFDAEPGICAIRRHYALARLGGWDQTAALRIAIKNVVAVLDAGTDKPTLTVVK